MLTRILPKRGAAWIRIAGVALGVLIVAGAPLRRRLPYLAVTMLVSAAILSVWLVYAYETGVLSKQIGTVDGYTGFSGPA
jgi:hypothetical protein